MSDDLGNDPTVAELLSRLANSASSSDRGLAGQLLAEMAPHKASILPILHKVMVADPDSYVRASAAYAVARLDLAGSSGLSLLLNWLHDDIPDIRWASAQFLRQLGEDHSEVISAMIGALADSEPAVRFHAAGYLGKAGRSAKNAVPNLIRCLNDEDQEVQEVAGSALGNLAIAGCQADLRPAIPSLLQLASDSTVSNRSLFVQVLVDIDPADPRVLGLLSSLLRDDDSLVRETALSLIDKLEAPPANN